MYMKSVIVEIQVIVECGVQMKVHFYIVTFKWLFHDFLFGTPLTCLNLIECEFSDVSKPFHPFFSKPKPSMYGIFTYICHKHQPFM